MNASKRHVPRGLSLGALLLLAAGPSPLGGALEARAAVTGASEHVEVTLLAERTAIRPGEPFTVGLRMRLEDGWHTYWKQPGDAGLPLQIQWTLPAGFTAGPIEWPVPERIETGELMSYGYEREVLLPVTITPPARVAAESVRIDATFDWLECKDVCLASSATLGLTLPVTRDDTRHGPAAPLFARARARTPRPSPEWRFRATAGVKAIELWLRPPAGVAPSGAYFFVDQPLVVEHASPQGFERVENGFRLTMVPAENAETRPAFLSGVLVVDGALWRRGYAIAVNVAVEPGDPAPVPDRPKRRAWPPEPLYAILAAAALAAVLLVRIRARRAGTKSPS